VLLARPQLITLSSVVVNMPSGTFCSKPISVPLLRRVVPIGIGGRALRPRHLFFCDRAGAVVAGRRVRHTTFQELLQSSASFTLPGLENFRAAAGTYSL
jgi:hypothetical protein